jgi:hypothetical protein
MTPDRKSQQRIGHICAHTLIFMRAGCLIVACGDVLYLPPLVTLRSFFIVSRNGRISLKEYTCINAYDL